MAARTASKGLLPVLRADAPDFEASFEKLVNRRRTASDVEKERQVGGDFARLWIVFHRA